MKYLSTSSNVSGFSIPWINVSIWGLVERASVSPSAVFQAMKRLKPADNEPALASKPSEITSKPL